MKKIYIGNLSHRTAEEEVKAVFAEFGSVQSVSIIRNRHTGECWGYGFVEMESDEDAADAIATLNGTQIDGITVRLGEARSDRLFARRTGGEGRLHGRHRWR